MVNTTVDILVDTMIDIMVDTMVDIMVDIQWLTMAENRLVSDK